jgi:hypothetical protein
LVRTSQCRASPPTPQMGLFQQPAMPGGGPTAGAPWSGTAWRSCRKTWRRPSTPCHFRPMWGRGGDGRGGRPRATSRRSRARRAPPRGCGGQG